jgi:hypothetical protein
LNVPVFASSVPHQSSVFRHKIHGHFGASETAKHLHAARTQCVGNRQPSLVPRDHRRAPRLCDGCMRRLGNMTRVYKVRVKGYPRAPDCLYPSFCCCFSTPRNSAKLLELWRTRSITRRNSLRRVHLCNRRARVCIMTTSLKKLLVVTLLIWVDRTSQA